jgi:heme-degrading monooxygenase HmoA
MDRWVEITFDCLPLRNAANLRVPEDASPKLEEKFTRMLQAVSVHGTHNSYYLHNALCKFHLTNDPSLGMVAFAFEGTLFTDSQDARAVRSDLMVELREENCSWLNQQIVDWLCETVHRAVLVEFDRYIEAGDLEKVRARLAALEKSVEESGGYIGMYL